MDYEVTMFGPVRRVVPAGTGSGVEAEDEIVFEATPTGTRIDCTADIRLRGVMRLATPFAGGALTRIARLAREARDGASASNGMASELTEVASLRLA